MNAYDIAKTLYQVEFDDYYWRPPKKRFATLLPGALHILTPSYYTLKRMAIRRASHISKDGPLLLLTKCLLGVRSIAVHLKDAEMLLNMSRVPLYY